ncbi:hypothetical protein RCZ15_14810 [Capnocytophaga catalasegens]|uniref:TonB C-terminal domain-containing protein n=2 Tax=Capnocytophaga catalasegens TaxID=1004260 RepID=A0AAV5AZC6_9FLAO|nr:hypothetical protein RCZ03_13410 [Capnocytophaga catalasegens]GJM50508.1 hypothetical protein RCZ15_14810 [Capnocytophaga catalasegens]GJM52112.1 hypothetical protein RCZ16_04300 [Capnocytophaga catalasegens]
MINKLQAQVYEYHNTDVKPAFKVCEGLEEFTFECFMGEISRQVVEQMPSYEKKIGLIKGEVFATFIVNKEGKIEVSSIEGDNRLTGPASEMLANVKDIIPAKKNGQNVSVQFSMYVPFLWLK